MDHAESSTDLTSAPRIENIEIIELLGKGGMSIVYKARQTQLDRIVAVKILSKSAIRGQEGIKRFQKEAKLTSNLDHPNIVKTISFGVSTDGQPYLVMEYLKGLSLADDLKFNGRLQLQKFKDLFIPALNALESAHKIGMVHRDIKPANIMICQTDTGAETVKLLDFGIAKVFGESEDQTDNLTKSGAVLGTPTYMSPEQCQGKALDGRSDLYSMACVMYETLCGEPPFSGNTSLELMQKHSIEAPPTVSDLSRKIDIRKELAQVTLWGLAKEPALRPQTASEFGQKLNSVLGQITLDKVPRLKSQERHKTNRLFLLSTVLLFTLTVATTIIFINKQNESKMNQSMIEELEAAKRKDGLAYLESGKQSNNDKDWKTAESYLNQSIALAFTKEKKLRVKQAVFTEAADNLLTALENQHKPVPDALSDSLESIQVPDSRLYDFHYVNSLLRCGKAKRHTNRYEEAAKLDSRALQYLKLKQSSAGGINNILEASGALAQDYIEASKYREARSLLRESLDLLKNAPKYKISQEGLRAQRNLLHLYSDLAFHRGDASDSEYLSQALVNFESSQKNDPEFLKLLARSYAVQAKYSEAALVYKRLISIEEKNLSLNTPELAESLRGLAICYTNLRDYKEAETTYRRSLSLFEKEHRKTHPEAKVLFLLGKCLMDQKKYSEAKTLLERSLRIREKAIGTYDKDEVCESLCGLGACYQFLSKVSEAESIYKRSLAIREAEYGTSHKSQIWLTDRLADCDQYLGKTAEAEAFFKRSIATKEKFLGGNNFDLANSLYWLALFYQRTERYQEAEQCAKRALAIRQQLFSPDNQTVVATRNALVEILKIQGKNDEAEAILKSSIPQSYKKEK